MVLLIQEVVSYRKAPKYNLRDLAFADTMVKRERTVKGFMSFGLGISETLFVAVDTYKNSRTNRIIFLLSFTW